MEFAVVERELRGGERKLSVEMNQRPIMAAMEREKGEERNQIWWQIWVCLPQGNTENRSFGF